MKCKFFWHVLRNTPIRTEEKENAWETLANKYVDANVTKRTHKQLGACWKNLKKKTYKNIDASDRKELFRTGGGPPPVDVPDNPIAQTIDDSIRYQTSMMMTWIPMIRRIIFSYLI